MFDERESFYFCGRFTCWGGWLATSASQVWRWIRRSPFVFTFFDIWRERGKHCAVIFTVNFQSNQTRAGATNVQLTTEKQQYIPRIWENVNVFNTWGRSCPWSDFLSDWSAQRRRDGSVWRGPGWRGRAWERRVQREGRKLLNQVEECQ